MPRPRWFIVLVALAATAGAGVGAAHATGGRARAPRPAAPVTHPNFVLVLTDDLSRDLVRAMPHVRAMMARGMSLRRHIVTDSLCCPSRSSIFTGRFPHDTGVFDNTPPDGGFAAFNAHGNQNHTFATALAASPARYRTAMMGKYLNGYSPRGPSATPGVPGPPAPVPPGWTDWAVAGNGYQEFDYDLNINGSLIEHHAHRRQDYLTDVLSQKGQAFISSAAAEHRPFLLELATFAPHGAVRGRQHGHAVAAPRDRRLFPGATAGHNLAYDRQNTQPPRWLGRRAPLNPTEKARLDFQYRKRLQAARGVDRMIGRLEVRLAQAGVAQDTYFVFTSDNGFHLGQHRLMAGKQTAFDHDIRVPFVVTGPGVAHGRRHQLTENIDLAPTFARLAGVAPPAGSDGHNLAPLLRPATQPRRWRHGALIEHHGPDVQAGDPDRQFNRAGNPTTYEALRSAHSVYVEYRDGEREFYDLRTDRGELHNIYRGLPQRIKHRLHRRLLALERCHGARACWRAGRGRG